MVNFPYHWNPIDLEITPLIRNDEGKDLDYSEQTPKQYDESNPYRVKGQIVYTRKDQQQESISGDEENTLGRFVCKKNLLAAAGIVIKTGDLLTFDGSDIVRYRIVEPRQAGHLRATNNLIRFEFTEEEFTRKSS